MRPAFLTQPGAWIRTGSSTTDPVRYACALESPNSATPWVYVITTVAAAVAIGAMLAWSI